MGGRPGVRPPRVTRSGGQSKIEKVNTIPRALMVSVSLVVMLAASSPVVVCAKSAPKQAGTVKPCHEHPNLEASCFVIHGRLSMSNGTPEYRILRIGTKRVLGVSASHALPGYARLPESVATMLTWERDIIADFTLCPFTKDEPGRMQLVCIDNATNVRVVKHTGS